MREKIVHLAAILGFATLFYVNSFGNFFVWNDWTLIVENFLVKDWSHWPEIIASPFWKPLVGEPSPVYRPLVSLSLTLDFSLWGLNPWGYHLTNTLLHAANALLFYFLAGLYVAPTSAWIAALLFAVHPIQTEAVAYISGRGELLMAFFLLSGALAFLASERRNSRLFYLVSLPLCFFSLLAKETGAIFPLLLLVADRAAFPLAWKGNGLWRLSRLAGPLAVLALYFILRKFFVGLPFAGLAPFFGDPVSYFLYALRVLSLCVGLLLFPFRLHFLHRVDMTGGPTIDLQLMAGFILLAGAVWGLFYGLRSRHRALVFALGWFLVALLPTVGLGLPLFESRIYLPSIGFFLLVSLGLAALRLGADSRLPILVSLLAAVLLGALTFERNRDWKDETEIALHSLAASPDDPALLRLYGEGRFKRGETEEAERILQKAAALAPRDPMAHESLGRLYSFRRREAEALAHFERARQLLPGAAYPHWRIGRYYLTRKKPSQAEAPLREAAKLRPRSSEIRNDLALAYFQQGKIDQARAELQRALEASPYSAVLRSNLERVMGRNSPSTAAPPPR